MTRQLFIPAIGTEFTLAQQWDFTLYNEHRNETLMQYLGDSRSIEYGNEITPAPASLPASMRLRLDRIYIRKGLDDFDSITFMLLGAQAENASSWMRSRLEKGLIAKLPRRPVRFWVKLEDANNIVFH